MTKKQISTDQDAARVLRANVVPPARGVASLFNAPELALDFGVPDLSDRVDYYRFHGLPDDA